MGYMDIIDSDVENHILSVLEEYDPTFNRWEDVLEEDEIQFLAGYFENLIGEYDFTAFFHIVRTLWRGIPVKIETIDLMGPQYRVTIGNFDSEHENVLDAMIRAIFGLYVMNRKY